MRGGQLVSRIRRQWSGVDVDTCGRCGTKSVTTRLGSRGWGGLFAPMCPLPLPPPSSPLLSSFSLTRRTSCRIASSRAVSSCVSCGVERGSGEGRRDDSEWGAWRIGIQETRARQTTTRHARRRRVKMERKRMIMNVECFPLASCLVFCLAGMPRSRGSSGLASSRSFVLTPYRTARPSALHATCTRRTRTRTNNVSERTPRALLLDTRTDRRSRSSPSRNHHECRGGQTGTHTIWRTKWPQWMDDRAIRRSCACTHARWLLAAASPLLLVFARWRQQTADASARRRRFPHCSSTHTSTAFSTCLPSSSL